MGFNISTDERGARVWRDDKYDFPKYTVSVSKKGEDGKYTSAYVEVRFRKGVELENGTDILFENAFPSFNVGKDGRKFVYWFIPEFERMDGKPQTRNIEGIDIPVEVSEEENPFI